MSSERLSGAPSPPPEGDSPAAEVDLGLVSLVRARGAPLLDALERHLPGSREHAAATASYAFATAVELGNDRRSSELIRETAKLHEIGKVYVSATVLARQPGERTADERVQLEGHSEAAYRLARGAGIPDKVCGWILHVRERFDGDGPRGLAGAEIPLESRIARAACACHRGFSARPETGAASQRCRDAVGALRAAAGTELDPQVVAALAAALDRIPLAEA